jgi:hypothetical protein
MIVLNVQQIVNHVLFQELQQLVILEVVLLDTTLLLLIVSIPVLHAHQIVLSAQVLVVHHVTMDILFLELLVLPALPIV